MVIKNCVSCWTRVLSLVNAVVFKKVICSVKRIVGHRGTQTVKYTARGDIVYISTYQRSNICYVTVKKKNVFKTNVSVDYLFKHDGDVCFVRQTSLYTFSCLSQTNTEIAYLPTRIILHTRSWVVVIIIIIVIFLSPPATSHPFHTWPSCSLHSETCSNSAPTAVALRALVKRLRFGGNLLSLNKCLSNLLLVIFYRFTRKI